MIDMTQIQCIKHLYENEEKSLREIARIMALSFQTVQKYAYQSNWNAEHLPNTAPANHPILGSHIATIDSWLAEDMCQPRKQRHTATRIFHRLQKECGFAGSYSSVKKYVRKKKYIMKISSAGYLPLAHPMGHTQVDFGAFKYYDGLRQDGIAYALTISFPFSNMAFTQVFKSENQECLLEGMKRIFLHIGGVPLRIRADNMTTAVVVVLKGTERTLTNGFARFMLHYRFCADFCNPASGNEKGNVENKVGYSRRNFFVPVPTIEDFEDFNEHLWKMCEEDGARNHYTRGVPIKDLWEQERKVLLPLPEHEYRVFRYESARISNYGYVTVDTNKYGLSPELAGQTSQLKIYFDKVELFCDHTLLAVYVRSYGKNEEVVDWRHYVGTLCKKPGAAEHTRFFSQLPKLWQEHLRATQGKERKTALLLLKEIVQDGNSNLSDEVLNLAERFGRSDSDSIRQCYYRLAKEGHSHQPLALREGTPTLNYAPNLLDYDRLTGGVANV